MDHVATFVSTWKRDRTTGPDPGHGPGHGAHTGRVSGERHVYRVWNRLIRVPYTYDHVVYTDSDIRVHIAVEWDRIQGTPEEYKWWALLASDLESGLVAYPDHAWMAQTTRAVRRAGYQLFLRDARLQHKDSDTTDYKVRTRTLKIWQMLNHAVREQYILAAHSTPPPHQGSTPQSLPANIKTPLSQHRRHSE